MLPSLKLNAESSFDAINLHVVGLNRPSWHTNLRNPFYFILSTNPTTTEIEQSLLTVTMISLAFQEMYSSWKKLTRFKLGGFKLRAALSLNLHRHLEPHNNTVLENFQESALNLTITTPLGFYYVSQFFW